MATKQLVKKTQTKPTKVEFDFYAPDAKTVFLVGSFNDWSVTANPLKKVTDGMWRTSITLTPGRYEYRFLIDGVWEGDQKPVETIPNAFGSWNCVTTVQ